MKAKIFDRTFDDDNRVAEALDLKGARRLHRDQRRVNVDFPAWMIESLDNQAVRLGVTRQSVIKVWLPERLQSQGYHETP